MMMALTAARTQRAAAAFYLGNKCTINNQSAQDGGAGEAH
jgi:hypothetical protein